MREENLTLQNGNAGANGGNGSRPPGHYFVPEPEGMKKEKPSNAAPSQVGVAAEASLPWLKGLWEFGQQRAIQRGSYRSNEDDVKSLIEKATAEARANAPLPWDKVNNDHDAQLVRNRENLAQDGVQAKAKHSDDLSNLEEAEAEHANFYRDPTKPSRPIISIVLATLVLGLSMAPSFYDGFFYRMDDELLAWALSSIIGLVASAFVSFIILGEFRHV